MDDTKSCLVEKVANEKAKKKTWTLNGKAKSIVKGTLGTGVIAVVALIISHVDARIDDTNAKVDQNIALMKDYIDAKHQHIKSDLETVKSQVKAGQSDIKQMIRKLDNRIYKWITKNK